MFYKIAQLSLSVLLFIYINIFAIWNFNFVILLLFDYKTSKSNQNPVSKMSVSQHLLTCTLLLYRIRYSKNRSDVRQKHSRTDLLKYKNPHKIFFHCAALNQTSLKVLTIWYYFYIKIRRMLNIDTS